MKRKFVIAISLALLGTSMSGQQARFDFVDVHMERVPEDQAAFQRKAVLEEDGLYHVQILFLDGQTRMTGTYLDEALHLEDGWFEFFFFGGKKESAGSFSSGKKVGLWNRWDWRGNALPDRHYSKANPRVSNQAAAFPGGHEALSTYIEQHLSYPEEAKRLGISGEVKIAFSISEEGRIHNVQVLDAAHPLLGRAGLALIAAMPNWQPAIKSGTAITSNFILPITYELTSPVK